ncbi:response regulator [Paenibacillus sp. GCM10023248]|uniref:response regulator transcription factor n=1 Tax=unclassified Paenibacillus TaxID=185978 RepID=UPI00237891C2|nr:response regulator transcription factor [Paenibacillus sp. MAHUQ-63]MDD9267188.1 response regulator transcription factor [Paenibacillus sp. MAHUQ-63]
MYRVFLVDDEPLIVEGLSNGVNWDDFGLELCGTADNGRQALDQLRLVPADILITDISMPVMNGLDLIRCARQIRPELKVIILSGYDEFNYLKEGMMLGIENYLLKPIHFEELYSTLSNTVEKLNAGRQSSDYSDEEIDILRDNVLFRWMTNRINAEQLDERTKLLGINLKVDYVMAGIVRHHGHEHLYGEMKRQANEDDYVIPFRDMDGDFVFAFLGATPEACRQRAIRCMSNVKDALPPGQCGLSLGSVERTGGGERHSYENAKKAQEFLILLAKSEIAQFELLAAREGDAPTSEIDWAEYGALLLAKEMEELYERIEIDFRRLQTMPGITPEILRGMAIEAMMRMKLETQKFKHAGQFTVKSHKELVAKAARASDLNELLAFVKTSAQMYADDLTIEEGSPIIHQVLKYLETHYAEELSLKLLGYKYHIHPVYLGRLFQQETNEAFTGYLNKIRIDKAKALLANSSCKINEVSRQVGYWEPSYFYKQFKKYVGVTPAEFKAMLNPLP